MIRHSILWGLGLFILYNLLVMVVGPNVERRADEYFDRQREWHKMNLLRAQQLVNTDLTGRDVYLGSSLGNTLFDPLLPQPFQKLTLIGGDPLTGLRILNKCGQSPRRVFIESNYALTRPVNGKLVKEVTGWRGRLFSRGLPAFRMAYRPADFLGVIFFAPRVPPALTRDEWDERRRKLLAEPLAADDSESDAAHVRKMKDLWMGEITDQSTPEAERMLDVLVSYTRALEAHGVEIVFYHMPMDPDVASAANYRRNQELLASRFPPDRYRWVQPAPDYQYRTMDGFHLADPSRRAYTRHLVMSAPEQGSDSAQPHGSADRRQ